VERFWVLGPPGIVGALIGAFVGGALINRLTALNPSRVLMTVGAVGVINAFGDLLLATVPPIWALMAFTGTTAFGGPLIGLAANATTTQLVPPVVRTQGIQMLGLA